MTMYGKTYKKIRLSMKFRQIEVSERIITRTALSKFENCRNSITLDNFIEILNNLDLSIEEFFFIHNGYEKDDLDKILDCFFSLTSNQDVKELDKVIHLCGEYLLEKKSVSITLIKKTCLNIKKSKDLTLEVVIKELDYLAKEIWSVISYKDDWTYLDIRLIANLIYIFDSETIMYIHSELENKIKKYNGFKNGDILITSLKLNISVILMKLGHFDLALNFLQQSLEMSNKTKRYDFKLFSLLRIGIIEDDLDKINLALEMGKLIDDDLHKEMEIEFIEFTEIFK